MSGLSTTSCVDFLRRHACIKRFLIAHGADLEAVDTYGYTPLHRMASNNLAIGAAALLDAGADPKGLKGSGVADTKRTPSPMEVAASARARDVVAVLQQHHGYAKTIKISSSSSSFILFFWGVGGRDFGWTLTAIYMCCTSASVSFFLIQHPPPAAPTAESHFNLQKVPHQRRVHLDQIDRDLRCWLRRRGGSVRPGTCGK